MKNIDQQQLVPFAQNQNQNDPAIFSLSATTQGDGYSVTKLVEPDASEFNFLFRNTTQAAYTVYNELYEFLTNNGITPDENNNQQIYNFLQQALNKNGNMQPWNSDISYNLGAKVIKTASWTGLGANPEVISIVYKSKITNNLGNALPNDFTSNENWAWVDVEQPQDDIRIDLSGHIGAGGRASVDANIPKNWAKCDGQTVTKPDGTTYTPPNSEDRTILLSNNTPLTQGGSHNWVFPVVGSTLGHSLTEAENGPHLHYSGSQDLLAFVGAWGFIRWGDYGSGGQPIYNDVASRTSGSGLPHAHQINLLTSSSSNRVPYEKWIPIVRVW